jgi:adenine-specific DNA methylase
MEKYLGNKRVLVESLGAFVDANCPEAKSILDIFAGTTNVGRYFRKRGFSVTSNDINRFSFILGSTYLALRKYPVFEGLSDVPSPTPEHSSRLEKAFSSAAARDKSQFFPLDRLESVWSSFLDSRAVDVIAYLNSFTSSSKSSTSYITDYFTQFGRHSTFKSVRGSVGKRNYFSEENARKLDAILGCVRDWWQEGRLTTDEVNFVMTSIIEEVTLIANVNGTFHDFNRNRLWPNSLQELFLKVPLSFVKNVRCRVHCADAVDLARTLPPHDILYIDPPYNFRQYSAYYHFLNFIAAYPFLQSVDEYLAELDFVRGQNAHDDFTSDFCFRDRFIDALRSLIRNSACHYVVMSYYGGRNHWNHWSKGDTHKDIGFEILSEVFNESEFFCRSKSLSATQVRQNYQSRNGEQKRMIDEYFFFGERNGRTFHRDSLPAKELPLSPQNTRLALWHFRGT